MAEERQERDSRTQEQRDADAFERVAIREWFIEQARIAHSTPEHFTPETLATDLERRSNETHARDPELQALRLETLVERFHLHEERWQAVTQTLETLDKRLVEYEKRLERYEERERDRDREQGWERSR